MRRPLPKAHVDCWLQCASFVKTRVRRLRLGPPQPGKPHLWDEFLSDNLCSEWYDALCRYSSPEMVDRRLFLLAETRTSDWDGERDQPMYRVGWPGEPTVLIKSPKACIAYLREHWPERDHRPEELGTCYPEADAPQEQPKQPSKVVALHGPEGFRTWIDRNR